MEKLTPKQTEILNYLIEYAEDFGMPPTIEEIRQAMDVSSANGIRDHLRALERKGAIELVPGISRGIRFTGKLSSSHIPTIHPTAGLPIVGRVAAGSPILSEEHIEDHCQLDAALFKQSADFLLRVVGTSMKNIGIYEGDLLAIHKTSKASEGQIVVARVGDEVTVKRFRSQGDKVYLEAENEDFSPIVIDLQREELNIEGVVVGVLRQL